MIISKLKEHNISVAECAKLLGVATSQIYRWDREGISSASPYLPILQGLLDNGLAVKEGSKRTRKRKPGKTLTLTDTPFTRSPERPRPTSRPTIVFRKKP